MSSAFQDGGIICHVQEVNDVTDARTVRAMSPPRAILVTGLPATGKTTLARMLAARYRVSLIAKDVIKEPLLDALSASDAAQSRRLSDVSFAVLFALVRESLDAGASVVLEGNFRAGEHEQVLRDAFTVWTPTQVAECFCQVVCRVDEQERISRLTRRQSDPARHAGHRDADLAITAPAARGNAFLDLPGAQFIQEGIDSRDVLATVDDWWYSRTV